MIAATCCSRITAALAKWLVATYPVGEVMFFRSFFSFSGRGRRGFADETGLAVIRHQATARPYRRAGKCRNSISQTFTVLAFSLMPLAGAMPLISRHRCGRRCCR